MFSSTTKRSSSIDTSRRLGEVKRREKFCFPNQTIEGLIQALVMDKFQDFSEVHNGLSEILKLNEQYSFLAFQLLSQSDLEIQLTCDLNHRLSWHIFSNYYIASSETKVSTKAVPRSFRPCGATYSSQFDIENIKPLVNTNNELMEKSKEETLPKCTNTMQRSCAINSMCCIVAEVKTAKRVLYYQR